MKVYVTKNFLSKLTTPRRTKEGRAYTALLVSDDNPKNKKILVRTETSYIEEGFYHAHFQFDGRKKILLKHINDRIVDVNSISELTIQSAISEYYKPQRN